MLHNNVLSEAIYHYRTACIIKGERYYRASIFVSFLLLYSVYFNIDCPLEYKDYINFI